MKVRVVLCQMVKSVLRIYTDEASNFVQSHCHIVHFLAKMRLRSLLYKTEFAADFVAQLLNTFHFCIQLSKRCAVIGFYLFNTVIGISVKCTVAIEQRQPSRAVLSSTANNEMVC